MLDDYVPYQFVIDGADPLLFILFGPILGGVMWLAVEAIGFLVHHFAYLAFILGAGLPEAPAEFAAICGTFTEHAAYISPVAAWVPWSHLGVAFGITFAGIAGGFFLRLALKGLSFVRGAGL